MFENWLDYCFKKFDILTNYHKLKIIIYKKPNCCFQRWEELEPMVLIKRKRIGVGYASPKAVHP
jgi:hypothetical protein